MKELFEKWIVTHFGEHIKKSLTEFDEEDGYRDQMINAMWIGFNGYKIINDQ